MKNILLPALLWLALPVAGICQSENPELQDSISTDSLLLDSSLVGSITLIDEHCAYLDNQFDYRIKTLLNEEFMQQMTDGGGQLTGYIYDRELEKAETIYYFTNGRLERTFYYRENALVYVSEKELTYPYNMEENAFQYDKPETVAVAGYYFDLGILIHQHTIGESSFNPEGDMQEVLVNAAQKYQRILEDR
ncbi:MAG: hypothetical protein GYB31_12830 [Bacteroidetes bacterium]|nr:hypothetical protein [Bacteroidota bacterium]